jgi:hypothetical protein
MSETFHFIRQDTREIYELNATTRVRISEPASVTMRKVESGKNISDNYYIENRTVNFSGVIINVRNALVPIDITQWLSDMRATRRSSPPVLWTVYANGEVVPNCVITDLPVETDAGVGVNAWKVDINFKEVQFSERARLVEVPEAKETVETVVGEKGSRSSNTTKETETPVVRTVSAALVQDLLLLGGGNP